MSKEWTSLATYFIHFTIYFSKNTKCIDSNGTFVREEPKDTKLCASSVSTCERIGNHCDNYLPLC